MSYSQYRRSEWERLISEYHASGMTINPGVFKKASWLTHFTIGANDYRLHQLKNHLHNG